MSSYLIWPLILILVPVLVYLIARFASVAFYRSKKEYTEWIRKKGE